MASSYLFIPCLSTALRATFLAVLPIGLVEAAVAAELENIRLLRGTFNVD
jgi:hypothetical protein